MAFLVKKKNKPLTFKQKCEEAAKLATEWDGKKRIVVYKADTPSVDGPEPEPPLPEPIVKRTWRVYADIAEEEGQTQLNLEKCAPGNLDEIRDFVDWLSKYPHLTVLYASRCYLDKRMSEILSPGLSEHPGLRTLDLRGNFLQDAGVKFLAEALHKNRALQRLLLGGNDLHAPACQHLARLVRKSHALRELDLGGDEANDVREEGAAFFAEALPKSKYLRSLSLAVSGLGVGGTLKFAPVLTPEGGAKLIKLSLVGNYMQDEGAVAIAEALAVNVRLRVLRLGYNAITTEGAGRLADALRANRMLRVLALGGNPEIRAEGARCLAEALVANDKLWSLQLGGCGIGEEGAEHFAKMLRQNTTLKRLALGGNNVRADGCKFLADALRENDTLHALMIPDNNIGDYGAQFMVSTLSEANFTLRDVNLELNGLLDWKVKQDLRELLDRNWDERPHFDPHVIGYPTDEDDFESGAESRGSLSREDSFRATDATQLPVGSGTTMSLSDILGETRKEKGEDGDEENEELEPVPESYH